MFSILNKIAETFQFNFLNRWNSASVKTKQKNKTGDNIGRDKNIYYQNTPEQKCVEVVYAWGAPEEHQENHKIIAYEFDLTLLNKSDDIIKDLWVNFSSSGFNLEIEGTKHTNLFEGWNAYNQALNLVLKPDYRYAPQNLLYPFKIRIVLKKELVSNDAWLYFSFGAPNVKKVEKKARISRQQLVDFIANDDHSIQAFLKLLGLSNK